MLSRPCLPACYLLGMCQPPCCCYWQQGGLLRRCWGPPATFWAGANIPAAAVCAAGSLRLGAVVGCPQALPAILTPPGHWPAPLLLLQVLQAAQVLLLRPVPWALSAILPHPGQVLAPAAAASSAGRSVLLGAAPQALPPCQPATPRAGASLPAAAASAAGS